MNQTLASLLLAGSVLVPGLASAEAWILWEELDGKTRKIELSATHGFESRCKCIVAANKLMRAVSKKDGFELRMDPFDHETVMGKRGEAPNIEYKYALCYPSNFDPRKPSQEGMENQKGHETVQVQKL